MPPSSQRQRLSLLRQPRRRPRRRNQRKGFACLRHNHNRHPNRRKARYHQRNHSTSRRQRNRNTSRRQRNRSTSRRQRHLLLQSLREKDACRPGRSFLHC